MSDELTTLLQPVKRTQRMIWGFFFVLTFLSVLRAYSLPLLSSLGTPDREPHFRNIGYLMGFILAFGSFAFWSTTYSDASLQQVLSQSGGIEDLLAKGQQEQDEAQSRARVEALSAFDRRRYRLALSFRTALGTNVAVNYFIVVVGYMVARHYEEVRELTPFVTVAFLLNLLVFPRLDTVLKRSERWRHLYSE
jgi:hypothetical protein